MRPEFTPTVAERFWKKVDRSGGDLACWPWIGSRQPNGYGKVRVQAIRTAPLQAHRVAWELSHGEIPHGLWVLHRCDNPPCCNPSHLFLGTPKDNTTDMVGKGRVALGDRNGSRLHPEQLTRGDQHPARIDANYLARGDRHGSRTHPERLPRGSDHALAKVTEDQVREIRRRYAAGGCTQRELGQEFGLSQTHVSGIIGRRKWHHLE